VCIENSFIPTHIIQKENSNPHENAHGFDKGNIIYGATAPQEGRLRRHLANR
jgi:hypothetical protein